MIYTVISLSPPYGSLVALLQKKIETRDWQTSHRGQLLIHQTAAPGPKGTTEAALWDLCLSEPFSSALPRRSPATLPRGKIVALVGLRGCRPTGGQRSENGGGPKYADWVHELNSRERAFGDYSPGRYGWIFDWIRPLPEPIAARGMPGLWKWEGDVGLGIAHAPADPVS